jgi:WD40 repeat protein
LGLADQQTQQKFPFPHEDVFDGLLAIIPRNWSWTLKSHDRLLGRITVSTLGSLFSYGENITMKLDKIDEENTLVTIESSLKVGMNIAAAHRHAANFESIISELSHYLQYEKDKPLSENKQPSVLPRSTTKAQTSDGAKTSHWVWIGGSAFVICLIVGIVIFVQSAKRLKQTWTKTSVPMAVKFSPSNEIAIGTDREIEVVDAQTGGVRRKYDFPFSNVRSIAFSSDGLLLAVGGGQIFGQGNFTIWNLQSNQIIHTVTFDKEVDSVDFSPSNQLLALTASDKLVRLFNIQTGAIEELSGHTGEVLSVAFSPRGDLLVSGSADDTIKIWNVLTKKVVRELTDCDFEFAISPDGKMLAVSGKQLGTVKLFDMDAGELLRTLTWSVGDRYEVKRILFLGNSKLLAVGGGQDFDKPGEIRLYDTETGNTKDVLTGHQGLVTDLSFSSQEPVLVSSGAVVKDRNTVYGEVKVWSVSKP